MEPVVIPYRTEHRVRREGIIGSFLRFCAGRPYLAGFAGGTLANVVAFLKSPGVIETAPFEALFLGLVVLASWVVLFGMMRPFFDAQTYVTQQVSRLLLYDGSVFQFIEEDVVQRSIEAPGFRLVTRPVPPEILDSAKAAEQPWNVWLEVVGEDARFVLQTKVAAHEAASYEAAPDSIDEEVDERLPTHIASPFLILGRDQAGMDEVEQGQT